MIDLAQPGRDRPHRRPGDPRGQLDLAEPLVDLLAGEVDVGVVAEDGDDLGEAELRDRADLLQALQPAEGVLHGEGDQPLDLLGRQRRGDGVDLHLDRRGVGEGVQRQAACGPDPEDDQHGRQKQDDEAVPQAELDQGVEHHEASVGRRIGQSLSAAPRRFVNISDLSM